MKQGKVIGFNATKMAEQMMANAVAEQNRRLVEYAKEEIKRLGDMIQTYNSENHMDRTGHLLNSLCWVVMYEGDGIKFKESGFYREPKLNTYINRWKQERFKGVQGGSDSYLHELFGKSGDMEIVNGRQMAEEFISSFKGASHKWKVAFAVLAPYWGYWESGHTNVFTGQFKQFQVMSHIYDDVRMALKPAETHLTVYVPKYIYKNRRLNRKLNKRTGIKKIGIDR